MELALLPGSTKPFNYSYEHINCISILFFSISLSKALFERGLFRVWSGFNWSLVEVRSVFVQGGVCSSSGFNLYNTTIWRRGDFSSGSLHGLGISTRALLVGWEFLLRDSARVWILDLLMLEF